MARYEDTTQYERDVMTSLGYHWRGEGWQRGFDLSDGDMVVEAWVGDRLPERQKELSNITHLWDQISDINKLDWPLYFQTLFIALPITGSPPQIFPWRTISQCTVRMPFVVMFEGLRKVLCRC